MHFSRSLAGVALLGVFAAMAFAGAATGAPAQSEGSLATVAPLSGKNMKAQKLGRSAVLAPVASKAVEKNPYKAITQASAKGNLLAGSVNRNVPKAQKPFAQSYKAPSGLNATAVAQQSQPITGKHSTVLSSTGVNAFQQEQFGGYNLEPPDPSLCAGQGFVIQVVNSQVQISNGNLNKLTAPIPMEAFFGDFVNSLFDPLCSYNHSTGRWYMTEAVSDFATFSGVYIAVSTSSDPRGPWNIYFLDLGTFGGDPDDPRPCRAAPWASAWPTSRTSAPTSSRSRSRRTSSASPVRSAPAASVALRTSSSTRSRWRWDCRSRTSSGSTSRAARRIFPDFVVR